MNPLLNALQPYPFERLRALFAGVSANAEFRPISLGIGEPKHPTPAVITETFQAQLDGLAVYPATGGNPAFKQACADWVLRRYGAPLDASTQVLPVSGTREALFSLAQAVVDRDQPGALVAAPNPFYQIYEGAALLAGAQPLLIPSDPAKNFGLDWSQVSDDQWARVQLAYVCSPGNPTGAVMSRDEWAQLFELSDRHGFVIAADECYSEIYFGDTPPLGALQVAQELGRDDLRNLVFFTSLSKRSNAPGLRSGFVAGDAEVLKRFLLYRTYHGSALSVSVQAASAAAWADEAHVQENRRMYRDKFAAVTPLLAGVMDVRLPDAGFYLWAGVPAAFAGDDARFARELFAQYNVTVLPGSYLAREVNGHNPGAGRVRMALVAETAECVEAAQRIVSFCQSHA
jgi:N-succinyldiaminopimelate aminotransferase